MSLGINGHVKNFSIYGIIGKILLKCFMIFFIFIGYAQGVEVSLSEEIQVNDAWLRRLLPNLANVRMVNRDDLVKNKVLFEGSVDLESKEYGCSLYLVNDFNRDGQNDVAICGVYLNHKLNKQIPFLVIVSRIGKDYRMDFLKEFSNFFYICKESERIKLQKSEVIRLAFKVHSDWAGGIFWKGDKYVFRYHSSP